MAHVFTLTTGTALAQGFTVIGTLVLARRFAPADFGVLALFMAITSVLSPAACWRYEAAIMLPERNEDAVNVKALAFLILISTCGLSLVAIALFRHAIAGLLREERLAPWLWGVPVSLFLSGLYQILKYWSSRMKQFQRLAISIVSQAVATFVSQLGLAVIGVASPTALVGGWILGQAVGTTVLGMQAVEEFAKSWKRSLNWTSLRTGFYEYKNFPTFNTPYLLAQTAAQQFIFFVLRIFASIHVVGLFSIARRAVYAPVILFSSSMQQVFYEKAATELKSGRLEPFVLRILKLQVAVGTPALVVFIFEAKPLFRFLLGDAWAEVGGYAAMLAFLGYMDFLASWMERIFDVQGKQKVALTWELSRDIVVIGGLGTALVLTRNPLLSVGLYVGLDFLCAVAWLIVAFRIAHFAVKNFLHIGAICLGSGSAAAAVLWAVQTVLRVR